MRKFKDGQRVIIPNFMINGTRMDVTGIVCRYIYSAILRKESVEVMINSVYILFDESQLKSYEETKD